MFDLIALITFVLALACVILNALFVLKGKKPVLTLALFGVMFVAFVLTGGTAAGLPIPILSTLSFEKSDASEPDPDRFILQDTQIAEDQTGAIDTQDLALLYGDLKGVTNMGEGVVEVKAKITLQKKENLSVDQDFLNVEDLIRLHGFDICQKIQYSGTAALQGGGDSRVISFTLSKSTIDLIMIGEVVGADIRDWAEDLWISNNLGS